MPLLHKNSDENNKHTPKGFTNASDMSVLLRDEKGESTYTPNQVLPAAINFVDGNAAPPTTVDGDIYVLVDEGNGAVDSGWNDAGYDDWVRYDGTLWYEISPSEGSICYDKTASEWKKFDGTDWVLLAPEVLNIYNTDDTLTGARTVTMGGNTLTFTGNTTILQGENATSSDSVLQLFNTDTSDVKLWDFKNDGTLFGYKSKTSLIAQDNSSNDFTKYVLRLRNNIDSSDYFVVANDGAFVLGKSNSVVGGSDYSTNGVIGNNNTINGTGSYKFAIGGINTINGNNQSQFAIGKTNTISGRENLAIGFSNNTGTSRDSYSFGRNNDNNGLRNFTFGSNNITNNTNNVTLGMGLESSADGAFVIGTGDNTNFLNTLENTIADSLALGWDTTTPQHLFFKTGAYIGGNSAIASEDISLQGDTYIGGYLELQNSLKHLGYTSSTAAPTTTELPNDKEYSIHKDTSAGTVYLAYNDGGTIKTVTLT
jgi:hypothetical protein